MIGQKSDMDHLSLVIKEAVYNNKVLNLKALMNKWWPPFVFADKGDTI